jgi:hypothetical protein
MRRKVIRLAGVAALTFGALVSGAAAQIERGPAALSGQMQNFTPIEKAACGSYWGAYCGPWHHRVCGRWRCWCAAC